MFSLLSTESSLGSNLCPGICWELTHKSNNGRLGRGLLSLFLELMHKGGEIQRLFHSLCLPQEQGGRMTQGTHPIGGHPQHLYRAEEGGD